MNMLKRSKDPFAPLSWGERFAYSSENVAMGIHVVLIYYLLSFYYTTYVGLNPGIVGTIMMVCTFIDAVSDVIMGRVIDKTHTRWGKARPWILFAAPIYSICMVLTFAVPMNATVRYNGPVILHR